MIFPERVLGRSSLHRMRFGRASLPIWRCDVRADLGLDLGSPLEVTLERHERDDRLAGELVRLSDDGRFGDFLVGHDRGLDLGGRETVAGDVDHVVDPPDDPQVPVLVADRRIADEIGVVAEAREIRLHVALIIPVQRAQHRRPRTLEHE